MNRVGYFLRRPALLLSLLFILLVVMSALFAPWLTPFDPDEQFVEGLSLEGAPLSPNSTYWLGTDLLGRDLFSRLIYGARTSLLIGVVANGTAVLIGVLVGLSAGYLQGRIGGLLMRFTDLMMAFPALLLAIALAAIFQPSVWIVSLVIAMVNWVQIARVIYAETSALSARDFIAVERTLGAGTLRILGVHLIPHLAPTVLVWATLGTTTFRGAATEGGYTEAMKLENRAGSLCRSLGYSEILTYSFVSPSIFDQIRLPEDSSLRNAMRIQNPLGEDASIMRTVALPSMLAILARNNAYHNDAVKLYELAKVYLPKPGQILPDEPKHLVLGTYGEHEDFFKMKGEIEAFLRGMNVPEARYTAEKHDPTFHPGRCARVSVGGVDLGCFGQIHPLVARSYGIDGEIFAAELNFTVCISK